MRWKEPYPGEERTVKRVLILPKKVWNETRWLEIAYIKQKYGEKGWENISWIDRKEQ